MADSAARDLTYAEALYEAIRQEMQRDSSVFVFGLGVDDFKGMYGTTTDLHAEFGAERNFDTPLAEDAMTGVAIGAALAGMRPVHVHQRMDFALLCMNQLVNLAAKMSYMSAGALKVPITARFIVGRSWGQGAQHSQALHSYFMHQPGLKVFAPVTPYDAKGCLAAAIRDDNPVVIMEHRMLYQLRGFVPEEPYVAEFGRARLLSRGGDITIVAISHMVVEAVRAGRTLAIMGIAADIIDPVSLSPLDVGTIVDSVSRTGRLLVVDNGWTTCGAAAEIVCRVIEESAGARSIKVRRMGFAPVPCPTTPSLERLFYPDARSVAQAAIELVGGPSDAVLPEVEQAGEIVEFRGPF